MNAVWFLIGAMTGATLGIFFFALVSIVPDDRCANAAGCHQRI